MRQIKFRAWHKLTKKIIIIDAILWSTHGYLAHTFDGFSGSGSLDDIELLQFTGLQDRNKKEIYDGDIIEIIGLYGDKQTAQVFWGLSYDSYVWITGETWRLRIIKGDVPGAEGSLHPYCEPRHGFEVCVVGNIYETPDLLAKEE